MSMDCSSPGSSTHGSLQATNTGGGCYALLQGVFPTQGSNLGLPHCGQTPYPLSHQGSYLGPLCKSSLKKKNPHFSLTLSVSPCLTMSVCFLGFYIMILYNNSTNWVNLLLLFGFFHSFLWDLPMLLQHSSFLLLSISFLCVYKIHMTAVTILTIFTILTVKYIPLWYNHYFQNCFIISDLLSV